jgi:hypothetical protein
MAAKDMTDALQNPHPEVPFASVRDDTILALAELEAIFKLKLHQTPSPTPRAGPPPFFRRPCLAQSSDQIMNSPMPASRQTIPKTTIHTQAIPKVPLLPRVVTPRSLRPSPPRVPTRSRNLSPRNLSQDYLCRMDTANMAIALRDNHWSQQHQVNTVIHPLTGKVMEYAALMKDPRLRPFRTRGFCQTTPTPASPRARPHGRTDAQTNPSAQRATQLRIVLARVYAVSRQNQITTTVP